MGLRQKSPAHGPARIAEDVDVRAPESQTFVSAMIAPAQELMMFGARFGRRYVGDLANKFFIPRRGQCNRLRKDSRDTCARATPCSPSFHQSYSGTPNRSMAAAPFIICEIFSSSVMRETRSSTRLAM